MIKLNCIFPRSPLLAAPGHILAGLTQLFFLQAKKQQAQALNSIQSPPPNISKKESYMTPCCYKAFVCLVTCKNSDKNLKIWVRFQDLKILWNWDFSSHWQVKMAITGLILKLQDWNFDSRTNHVFQLRLSDQLSKFSFF